MIMLGQQANDTTIHDAVNVIITLIFTIEGELTKGVRLSHSYGRENSID